jgi:hypothetical protein
VWKSAIAGVGGTYTITYGSFSIYVADVMSNGYAGVVVPYFPNIRDRGENVPGGASLYNGYGAGGGYTAEWYDPTWDYDAVIYPPTDGYIYIEYLGD